MGLMGTSILKAGFDWRKQWNLSKAVTEGTKQEIESLEVLVKDLASTTKFTMTEVASAVEFLGKAGNSATDQMVLLPTMLNLAAAAGSDLGRTADIMTNIAAGLRIPLSEIEDHADMITATFLNSNVTLEMFGDSMKKLGPLTSQLSIDFDDMATAIGLMGNAGIQGSESGVHLRRALMNLSDVTSPMRTKIIDMLGFNWDDLDVIKHGFTPVLSKISGELLTRLNKYDQKSLPSSAEFGLAGDIFGARAVSTVLALLGQFGDEYEELNRKIRESGGIMEETKEKMLDGLEPFYRLQAAIQNVKIAIAESGVLDAFANFADLLADKANGIASASDATKRLIFNLTLLGTVGGPAIIAVGLVLTTVARFGQMILAVGSLISFLTTPLGLAVAAILAVAGIAAYMATSTVESFQELWDGSSPLLSALGSAVLAIVGAISSALTGDWDAAWAYAKDIAANVATVIIMVMHELVNAGLDFLKNLLHFFTEHWNEISNNVVEALDWLFTETDGWLLAMGLLMFGGIRQLAIGVVVRFVWMGNQIVKLFKEVAKKTKKHWKPMVEALWESVRAAFKPVTEAFRNMWNAVLETMRTFWTWFKTRLAAGLRWMWGAFTTAWNNVVGIVGVGVKRVLARLTVFLGAIKTGLLAVGAILANPWVAGLALMTTVAIAGIIAFKDELHDGFKGMFVAIKWIIAWGVKEIGSALLDLVPQIGIVNAFASGLRWLGVTDWQGIDTDAIAKVAGDTVGGLLGVGEYSSFDEAFAAGAGRTPGELGRGLCRARTGAGRHGQGRGGHGDQLRRGSCGSRGGLDGGGARPIPPQQVGRPAPGHPRDGAGEAHRGRGAGRNLHRVELSGGANRGARQGRNEPRGRRHRGGVARGAGRDGLCAQATQPGGRRYCAAGRR